MDPPNSNFFDSHASPDTVYHNHAPFPSPTPPLGKIPLTLDPLPSNRPAHIAALKMRPDGRVGCRDMLPICGDGANLTYPRHLLFTLEPGEKKIESTEDSRVPNTSIFTLNKEDHTLGNLLSSRLRDLPYVTFAGYKAPHPLIAKIELRIGTDGSKTPKEALIEVCRGVLVDLQKTSQEFTKEMELFKISKGGDTNGINGF